MQSAQRFLDAIRSNLLFSRSVLLVEGDAEEILIPSLVKKIYGISLDEIGVSLINVRSTGFNNLGNLFHEDRLRKRCAIVTDSDAAFFSLAPVDGDSDAVAQRKRTAESSAKSGRDRKASLDSFSRDNPYLQVEYAPHTFEVDFADASKANREILVSTVNSIYTREDPRESKKQSLRTDVIAQYGQAVLYLAEKVGKGWFALLVSDHLDVADPHCGPVLPNYILNALAFAAEVLPRETWARIIDYRIGKWEESETVDEDQIHGGRELLKQFTHEQFDLDSVLSEIELMPEVDDRLLQLLRAFEQRSYRG